ncbi:MAG: hypothetical protein H8D78_00210 [Chloroflexi bacterium]|nr:hypothetical protein [Chloroflexota bacterium]
MLLLNFAHPLTSAQREQVEALAGKTIARIVDAPAQMANGEPFAAQVVALADGAGLTAEEWQKEPLLVNLPGYAPAAAGLLAEIHGRAGHFAAIVRMRPVEGSNPTVYEVAEIINLQAVRDEARRQR